MSSGKVIGGEDWVGKKVETWWGTTSKWEPGEIVEYKAIRDEYKVRYEDDEEHWEQVDSLFRFKDETAEKQKQELLKLQEGDIAGVKEKITKDSNLETWVKGFVRKIYVFLDGDTDQVLEFLDPDMKVIDQMPQLIRTQPFPLTQKLSTLRTIVRDDILFAKITKILLDEKAFPLVGRRKGHGRPRGRGRPKGSANRRIAKLRLAEHLDDIDVANNVSNFALCPPSPPRLKVGPNSQLPPEMAQAATSSTTRSVTTATKINDKIEESSNKFQEKEKEEDDDDDEEEILPPRKRIKLAHSESRAKKHEKEKEKEKTSKIDHVPDSPEGISGAGDNNAEDVTLDPSFMESIESLSFVRELARASGRRTHGKNATRWAPHFVKQQQKLFDAYQQGTIGTPQRTLRSRPPVEVATKEPKKRGRKKKEVTSEKGEGLKEKINSNSEKQDKQETQDKPEEKKEETKKEEPVKRKRGRPRKIRPKEEEERIKAEEAKKKERAAESKKADGEKNTAEPDKKETNGKERDEVGKRDVKATTTTETNKRDTSNLEKTDEKREEKGNNTNELSADGNSGDESDGKASLPLSHRRRKMEAQNLAAQNSTTASSKSASSEIKIEVDIESILNGPDENPTDVSEVSIRKSNDRVVAKKEEVFESELRSKLRNSGGKPLRSSLKKGQDEEFSEKLFRQRQDNDEHEQHKQLRSNEPAHFRSSEPLFRANESQRQHRPALSYDKEEKPDTLMETHDASEKSETHAGNFGANGSHKRKRKHMHLDLGGDPEMDLDAQAEKKRRLESALRKSAPTPAAIQTQMLDSLIPNLKTHSKANSSVLNSTGPSTTSVSHFSFDHDAESRDEPDPGYSQQSFQSCLSAAKSMAPAKKIWVLHNFRHTRRPPDIKEHWDFYLGQGPKVTQKRAVSLVTIAERSSCTCSQFKKTQICPHLLFTWVCALGVKEENPILQKHHFSQEELRSIFDNAPKDSLQTRLAPNQMVRGFYAWFDPNITEADRRRSWEVMCTEEERKEFSVHKHTTTT